MLVKNNEYSSDALRAIEEVSPNGAPAGHFVTNAGRSGSGQAPRLGRIQDADGIEVEDEPSGN